jgi:YebC/PmpR family DNA-binding regulatory protein
MSGHSKWSTIKHKKGALDEKKGRVFSQLAKLIRVAVKQGQSGDVNFNPSLRLVVDKAKAANMPKEKIQKAIDRGLGKSANGRAIQEIVYEGFGPQGIGLLIVAMTDNSQRTSAEIRNLLSKAGGSLAGPGSVRYMFTRTGEDYTTTMPMPITDPSLIEKLENLLDELHELDEVEEVVSTGVWNETEIVN